MGLAIFLVVIVIFTVGPVMLAAKVLNAGNSGFVSCLIAVVLAAIVSGFVESYFPDSWLGFALSILATAAIFSMVLSAKYVQSACIALLAVVIQYGSAMALAALGYTLASV